MSVRKRRDAGRERPRPPRGRPAEEEDLRGFGCGPAIDIRLRLSDGSVPAGIVLADSTVGRLRAAALAAGGIAAKELARLDPYADVDFDPAAVAAACRGFRARAAGAPTTPPPLEADVARAVDALAALAAKGEASPGSRLWALGN